MTFTYSVALKFLSCSVVYNKIGANIDIRTHSW